jgi:hypothetical protein
MTRKSNIIAAVIMLALYALAGWALLFLSRH